MCLGFFWCSSDWTISAVMGSFPVRREETSIIPLTVFLRNLAIYKVFDKLHVVVVIGLNIFFFFNKWNIGEAGSSLSTETQRHCLGVGCILKCCHADIKNRLCGWWATRSGGSQLQVTFPCQPISEGMGSLQESCACFYDCHNPCLSHPSSTPSPRCPFNSPMGGVSSLSSHKWRFCSKAALPRLCYS